MWCRRITLALAVILLFGSAAASQTVYTWKDDKGVVHFADEKPEGVNDVEKLTLEAPAPLVSGREEGEQPAEGGDAESMSVTPAAGGGSDAQAQRASGPSEVVFLGAELSPAGKTARNVRGRVRNSGGEPARRVTVRVVITDAQSGNLCTAGDLDVTPAALGAGETGTFEGTLDTPCFYANPKISYYPEWD
jgi:hypothetical protein